MRSIKRSRRFQKSFELLILPLSKYHCRSLTSESLRVRCPAPFPRAPVICHAQTRRRVRFRDGSRGLGKREHAPADPAASFDDDNFASRATQVVSSQRVPRRRRQ